MQWKVNGLKIYCFIKMIENQLIWHSIICLPPNQEAISFN